MSLACHDWLPLSALDHGSVRSPLEAAVAAWSAHWFARKRVAITTVQALADTDAQSRRDDVDGGAWRAIDNGLALSLSRRARARLAGWALDVDLEDLTPTGVDRRVVEAFETVLVDDLLSRVSAELGAPPPGAAIAPASSPYPTPGGLILGLADQGAPWFWLGVPFKLARDLRRRGLAPACTPTTPLSSRASAVATTPVRLEARLADAQIALGDLAALAIGDVLVLDQAADSLVQLRLPRGGIIAHGALTVLDGHTALTLHS